MLAAPAAATVVEQSATQFTLAQLREIAARSATVWAALIHPEQWWDPAHTYSGAARNLTLDARGGGCFCETWAGGSVEHLHVVVARPGARLRLTGGLGPLQTYPVSGVLTIDLSPSASGTTLAMTYVVAGHATGGLDTLAAPVDAVLGDQLDRLARRIATGRP